MAGVTTMLAQGSVLSELPWNFGSVAAWVGLAGGVALAGRAAAAAATRPGSATTAIAALAAGLLAFLAFASPIGVLADGQLFAAHMLQHILLLLVVPLGIVLAMPREAIGALLARPALRPLSALLSMAPLAWLAGVGAMWAWHQPLACSAALASPAMGAVRDLSFLLAGTFFWWPIVGPVAAHRVEPPLGVAYLVSACIGCTVLGVAVTFAASTPCPVFVEVAAPLPVVERLRSMGFTPRIDQQTGGLIMWMLPCLIYLAASVSLLRRWYAAPPPTPARPSRPPRTLEGLP